MPSLETTRLLPRLRQHFHLSQPELGHCLGLSRTMVSQVERGIRGLPMPAALPQAALTLALLNAPAAPAPEDLDGAALRRQQRACLHRAGQLAHALTLLPERAAWARRRLAALPTLTAALAPNGAPSPPWLAGFAAAAQAELLRSGSTAQARLRARQVALLAEAAELGQQLATVAESEK